jgi:DNA-binding CsgD family transcriptional regulator/tetratricopeptide (TPR) repeat protein
MGRTATCPDLVGREAELSTLDALLGRSIDGQSTTVVVGGDAGVGKTRLVRAFAERARARGARVVWGECPPLGDSLVPLAPIIEAARGLIADLGAAHLEALAGPSWPALAQIVPDLQAGAGGIGAERQMAPERAYDLLVVLGERLAAEAPLVVVIEDVHWADRSTLDLVTLASRRLRRAATLLVLTYRTDEPSSGPALAGVLAELGRRGADRIDLAPLTRTELAELLAAIQEAPVPDDVAEAIFARSQGYPFYAEELLAAVAEGGAGVELPDTLREILLARARLLPPAARQLVQLMAAAARRVDHRTLATVAGLDDATVAPLLRSASDLHLIRHDAAGYGFRHALVQEAVYADLLPSERVDLHGRFAAVLEASRPPSGLLDAASAAELAHHWSVAGVADRALRASIEAAMAADRVFAFAEAHHQYERALRLWDTVAEPDTVSPLGDLDLRQRAAESAHLAGDAARAVTIIGEALAGADDAHLEPRRLGLLHERRGRYLWASGDPQAATAAYEQAMALVPDEPTQERARVMGALGQMLLILTRYAEAGEVTEAAIDTARRVGARREEGHALTTLGVVLSWRGRPDDGVACLEEARRIAAELDDPEALARAAYNLSVLLRGNGRLDDAVAVALAGERDAVRLGLSLSFGPLLIAGAAEALFYRGWWEEADRHLTRSLAEAGRTMGARNLHQVAGMLATARGDFEEARSHLDAAFTVAGTRSSQPHHSLYPALAELALWQGRTDEGLRWAMAARSSLEPSQDRVLLARASALALRSRADEADRSGARARAEIDALSAPLRSFIRQPDVGLGARPWVTVAWAERSRALGASDPERWAQAAWEWEGLGYRYYAACARWREAEARLRRRGNRGAGSEVLRAAHRDAVELGARPLAEALSDLAGRSGIDLGQDAAGDLGLTPRELEVLALVATGLTNRAIAEQLFISEKTAGAHVSHILTKLGVTTRGAAAAVAHRLDLVGPPPR